MHAERQPRNVGSELLACLLLVAGWAQSLQAVDSSKALGGCTAPCSKGEHVQQLRSGMLYAAPYLAVTASRSVCGPQGGHPAGDPHLRAPHAGEVWLMHVQISVTTAWFDRWTAASVPCPISACLRTFLVLAPLPHSLQEKGWDVDQTIEKLLKNGTRISAEAHEIVRIPGLLTDADMIGEGGCVGVAAEGAHAVCLVAAIATQPHGPRNCCAALATRPHDFHPSCSLPCPLTSCRRHGVGIRPRRRLLVAGRKAGPSQHARGCALLKEAGAGAGEGACKARRTHRQFAGMLCGSVFDI